MHCSPTASNCQLGTEERARLKSTTWSTEEGSAVPLHRRREPAMEGEIKRENEAEREWDGEAERTRERGGEGGATHGSCFYSSHSPTSITCIWASRAPAQHWQQIPRVLMRNWQPEREAALIHRKWQCQLWYKYLILYCTAGDLIKGIMALIRLKLD